MKILKKSLVMILAVVMFLGTFNGFDAEAATLKAPKITVKTIKSGDGVKITISKTKNAEGYDVYGLYPGDYDFEMVAQVNKNGKAKRSVTVKNLVPGKYTFKVWAYKDNKDKTRSFSAFSKEITVEIKAAVYDVTALKGDYSKVKKGDTLIFGSYLQDYDENYDPVKKPVEWIVFEKTGKQMLLVSKYVLDAMPYNEEWKEVTWADCSLRGWLNSDFLETAFTSAEQKLIKTVTLKNPDNPKTGVSGGKDTKDKVFILSRDDMINPDYGYDPDPVWYDHSRKCTATKYAIQNSGYLSEDAERVSTCWLRTPGSTAKNAASMDMDDTISESGHAVRDGDGVRPALYIDLNP